jgi:uncharacterized membrane-anchored protein
MDSVSDEALRSGAELLVHAYEHGEAPGAGRIEELGLRYQVVPAAGMSEDVALLLAFEKGAELIVAVGTHGNLREFLDKGRPGMSSTFLVRLRVGEILMDAKGVARLYPNGARARDVVLLVAAVLVSLGLMFAASPALRLYLDQTLDGLVEWVRSIV